MFHAILAPIQQNPAYHHFADPLGSFWSNAAFALAALAALRHWPSLSPARRAAFLGCLAVSAGSAWYHANPTNATLVWDRLPMAIVFAAVFTEALASFRNPRHARLLAPLTALAAATVFYWHSTGDLRPYALVQFGPMLALPFLLWKKPNTARWWAMLGLYAIAKLLEAADAPIYILTGHIAGGHTLKHVAAAAALWAWQRDAAVDPQPDARDVRTLVRG